MYNPPGRPQHPSHSPDAHLSARSGIAGSWVHTTLKHSEEPVVKKATTTHVSTGTCDSSRYSTFSPALTGGVHCEKEALLVIGRARLRSLICVFLINGVVLCIFRCFPC